MMDKIFIWICNAVIYWYKHCISSVARYITPRYELFIFIVNGFSLTNFRENWIKMENVPFEKMYLKKSFPIW